MKSWCACVLLMLNRYVMEWFKAFIEGENDENDFRSEISKLDDVRGLCSNCSQPFDYRLPVSACLPDDQSTTLERSIGHLNEVH